jgi:hypothetical protein
MKGPDLWVHKIVFAISSGIGRHVVNRILLISAELRKAWRRDQEIRILFQLRLRVRNARSVEISEPLCMLGHEVVL